MTAFEAKIKKVQGAQKRQIETAKESREPATNAAAHLARSLRHITEAKGNMRKATNRLADK